MFGLTLFRTDPPRALRHGKITVSDAVFRRKLESSDTLRHMCGFDTELYQAMTELGH